MALESWSVVYSKEEMQDSCIAEKIFGAFTWRFLIFSCHEGSRRIMKVPQRMSM